ncbi:LIM-domain binding protein/SEUSS [Sesbania bispinosa]|nr:LIM-domain binding protein/SEUSS [Sesbania bispinosa]
MVPPGPPTPIGGAQSVSPSLLRSNSGMLGGQGGPMPSQASFPSLVSQRTQYNNMNMLGSMSNVTSILNQSFPNGIPNSGLSGPGSSQRGGVDAGAEPDPMSGVGNGMGFGNPSSSFVQSNMVNPGSSGQGQGQGQQFSNASGNQLLPDQHHSQQLEVQNFQHSQQQFSAPLNTQQQQHFQSIRGGMGGVGPVKLEPQVSNDQFGQQPQQQLPSLRSLTQMSRQSSQAAAAQMNLLHHQRLLQFQQHQQQQLLKAIPQQRSQLPQQFQQQNMPIRSPVKPAYEPGMCARRLTHYMYQQQHRPEDNNIDFWRKFVAEYFAPNAKKKWCVSMYGSGRQTTGVFPQDVWHCEICNRKPGRGFEATAEVLPRLFKIKYESGTLEELLYVDMPREYHNSSGQIVLDYAKAIQESVFEQLRVVRDGQLRIVFSPDLKICSWEFCARRHEELIPRRLLIPQISEVVNSMKDLIDYSRETGTGPMDSLAKFPRRTSGSSGLHGQVQQSQDQLPQQSQSQQQQQQHMVAHTSNGDQNSVQTAAMQIASSNGVPSVNNTVNPASTSTTTSTIVGLLHQNSMNSRQHSMNNASSPYGGSSVQQTSISGEADPSDAQSSVQKIIHEMMMSSQLNGTGGMVGAGSIGNDMKNVNGILPVSNNTGLTSGNGLMGNGAVNSNSGVGVGGYGTMGLGPSGMTNGMRPAMGNNSIMNGRGGMASIAREQAPVMMFALETAKKAMKALETPKPGVMVLNYSGVTIFGQS